jgi:hypothetical protein
MPRLAAVFVAILIASTISTQPASALRPPPFWKALGAVRQAWKESPEARFAFKVFRKTTTRAVANWRRSKGGDCAWRSVYPTYCRNGFVVAAVPIDFFLTTSAGTFYLGSAREKTVLSAACITTAGTSVRILWPTPRVPSVFVRQTLLAPFLGVQAKLPVC